MQNSRPIHHHITSCTTGLGTPKMRLIGLKTAQLSIRFDVLPCCFTSELTCFWERPENIGKSIERRPQHGCANSQRIAYLEHLDGTWLGRSSLFFQNEPSVPFSLPSSRMPQAVVCPYWARAQCGSEALWAEGRGEGEIHPRMGQGLELGGLL